VAGQAWQKKYNWTVGKDRTGQLEEDNQDRTTVAGQTARNGNLGQDRGSWDRTTNTGQIWQDNRDGTARTGHLRQDIARTGQSGEVDLTDKPGQDLVQDGQNMMEGQDNWDRNVIKGEL
jgi:hypothetical protein